MVLEQPKKQRLKLSTWISQTFVASARAMLADPQWQL